MTLEFTHAQWFGLMIFDRGFPAHVRTAMAAFLRKHAGEDSYMHGLADHLLETPPFRSRRYAMHHEG